MALQCLAVAFALVTEQVAKAVEPMAVGNQTVPIVVTDFMTQVAQQGAIGFVQLHPHPLAPVIIGLAHIEGDQAIGMTGHWCVALKIDADEIERKARATLLAFRLHRQAQVQQLRGQPALGGFQLAPA
ncbi:hypothetical protein D3C85_1439180 [compost metagenome]